MGLWGGADGLLGFDLAGEAPFVVLEELAGRGEEVGGVVDAGGDADGGGLEARGGVGVRQDGAAEGHGQVEGGVDEQDVARAPGGRCVKLGFDILKQASHGSG